MAESGSNPNPGQDRISTSRSPSEGSERPRRHILIVEDSKSDLFLIREALEAADLDAEIHVVNDGQAATRFFDTADGKESAPSPDVVLLDLNLPKKSGADVLRYMRQSPACRNARVLIVTSSDSSKDREVVGALNANAYFRKPSEFKEFMELGPIVKALLG